MKVQPKAAFVVLSAFAVSASADELRGKSQRAPGPSGALENALVYEEEAHRPADWADENELAAESGTCGRKCKVDADCFKGGFVQCGTCNTDEGTRDFEECIETPFPTPPSSKSKSSKSSKSTNKPTKKPTKKPSPSSSSSSRSSRSKKPTRKPTKKPSPSSRSERTADCLDDTEPKAKRDAEKYKFELKKSHHECLDKKKRKYQYGEFKDVKKDSHCARKCVEDSRSNLLGSLEGFDFNCKKERCRCLFDEGALNANKAKPYDSYNLDGDGDGEVKETKKKDDTYCFKLKDVKFVGLNGEFDDEDDGDYKMES